MTTITWKEAVNGGSQIIRTDDRRGSWPAIGEDIELNGRRYKVTGVERAEVLLEAQEPPPPDPSTEVITPEQKKAARERSQRLQQGLAVDDSKLNATARRDAGPDQQSLAKRNARVTQRLEDEEAHTSMRQADRSTPKVSRSTTLSRTARGNQARTAKAVTHATKAVTHKKK